MARRRPKQSRRAPARAASARRSDLPPTGRAATGRSARRSPGRRPVQAARTRPPGRRPRWRRRPDRGVGEGRQPLAGELLQPLPAHAVSARCRSAGLEAAAGPSWRDGVEADRHARLGQRGDLGGAQLVGWRRRRRPRARPPPRRVVLAGSGDRCRVGLRDVERPGHPRRRPRAGCGPRGPPTSTGRGRAGCARTGRTWPARPARAARAARAGRGSRSRRRRSGRSAGVRRASRAGAAGPAGRRHRAPRSASTWARNCSTGTQGTTSSSRARLRAYPVIDRAPGACRARRRRPEPPRHRPRAMPAGRLADRAAVAWSRR